jgi:hypothetical protein
MSIPRGVTYTLTFGSLTTAGAANTTTVPTCVISKDAGAQTAVTNALSAASHNGNGEWKVILTAAEMTAGTVSGVAYGAGLVPSFFRIITEADYTTARAVNLDNLNATVASRSTYAGGDTAGTTTLLGRIPGTVQPQTGDSYARLGLNGAGLTALGDTRLANLDTNVGSRLATTAYTAPTVPPTVAQIAAGILITPANKLATDASGYVTYNNAASGGGAATDWTDAERQQVRWVLGLDGVKAQPTGTPARITDVMTTVTTNNTTLNTVNGTVNGINNNVNSVLAQTNKMMFDGFNYLYVNVISYYVGRSPGEQILIAPSQKIATDSSGNVQTTGTGGGTSPWTATQVQEAATVLGLSGTRTTPTGNGTIQAMQTTLNRFTFDASNNVNAAVTSVPNVTVGGYAAGQSPANLILATPGNKLGTDAAGNVTVGAYAAGKAPNDLILITPGNKLATDAAGSVTASNATGGGTGGTDWTDAERQQIRFTLGLDGVKSQPATGAGSIQGIAAQTGKFGFDGSNNVRAVTTGITSTATVSGYTAGMGPQELVLRTPANKLATDALGNVVVPNVTLAANGLDLITFDNLTAKTALQGMSAVAMGEIVYDPGTQTGTVSSPTNPNVVKVRFSSDPNFTTRTNVALTLNA